MSQIIDVIALAGLYADTDPHALDRVVVDALAQVAAATAADHAYLIVIDGDDNFEITHEWTTPAIADNAEGLRAVLEVPVTMAGESIGMIGVNRREPVDAWPDDAVELLRRVASVTAGVLLRRRSLEARRRADETIVALTRQRDDLLAQASHELRTPLHAILGYAELVALETASARSREATDQILRNGRHLLALVEELLTVAPGGPAGVEVQLGPEIDAAVDALGDAAAIRGISIATSDRARSASMSVSPGRLRQLLYCLITGAVHAVEDGTDIAIDAPRPATVSLRLRHPRPGADPVNPLARALVGGYGNVEAHPSGDGAIEVAVTFGASAPAAPPDQGAKP